MSASNQKQNPGQEAAPVSPSEGEEQTAQTASQDEAVQPEQNLDVLLAEAQEQLAQYHEQLLRAKAETENIRRRATEDVAKARKFGIEGFAESLVPVKDSLEAALSQPDQSPEAWREGVETTLRQLAAAFERNALKEVAPAPGDKFDPHQHQAISSVPSPHPEGTVEQLLQKGYTIADRVLRPALVMVSSGQQDAQ
ncbi:nucleotide exchange factor GrpE [Paracandidimonas soli]|uniref:Protein GrpE n=1 Tax=Paracandidimonas soli TaxID=1917182 RepID=A0A4R3V1Z2_9BURK|nr:nucleotide exchange factor GrpE [Paracandidimonas soli]TCU97253.1 molecular chaperone GrpE [Paracandidimonas soli]